MKVVILKREERDGVLYRHLACGHEAVERKGGSGRNSNKAWCPSCSALSAHRAKSVSPVARLADEIEIQAPEVRSELQRLADELEASYPFPAGRAWGRADVLARKLIEAARRHSCAARCGS